MHYDLSRVTHSLLLQILAEYAGRAPSVENGEV
jgi:hypothetical protein